MAICSSSIVNGCALYAEGRIENLKEVYVNFTHDSNNDRQLSLHEKQTGMLRTLQTYNLEHDTLALDSGVIKQVTSKFLGRRKSNVKELYYISIIQRERTVNLVFDTNEERRKWKGSICGTLNLVRDPKKMLLVCPKYGTDPVTVHMTEKRIVVLSERKEHQPAHLKFAWDMLDIVGHSIENNRQLVLKNNQDITKRLECLRDQTVLSEIVRQIEFSKKRFKKPEPATAHQTIHQNGHQKEDNHRRPKRRRHNETTKDPLSTVDKPVEKLRPDTALCPALPLTPARDPSQESSSDDDVPDDDDDDDISNESPEEHQSNSKHSNSSLADKSSPREKTEKRARPPLPHPPPPPCPGIRERVEGDPLKIYGYPAIVRHFKPHASKRPLKFNLNKVAELLPKNLLDTELFYANRASLFDKFSECHRRSSVRSGIAADVCVEEILSPLQHIRLSGNSTEQGTQTSFDDIQLTNAEEKIYMVGYVIHKVIMQPPEKDTLQLPERVKKEICMNLYSDSLADMHDWRKLANAIGMTYKAVTMISGFLQNQLAPDLQTCAEVVFRHWQYTYNNYRKGHKHFPKYPCTQEGLRNALTAIGRHDLCLILDDLTANKSR